MQSLCLMCTCCTWCKTPVESLSCRCGAAPMLTPIPMSQQCLSEGRWLLVLSCVFAWLKGSCNPALLLPALLGRVTALSVNKLFIYFPHSSFNFFFPLLLSTCVQSMCSENMCSSKVLQLWKPGIQVCITLQCSEDALGSPRGIVSFFCSILQNVSAMIETGFLKKFLPF